MRRTLGPAFAGTALVATFASVTGAQTVHSDQTISTPTTWSPAGNPHIVSGTLTVNSTLTIDDGCVVQFENASYANVNGSLTAVGTAPTGILFTRNDPLDEWRGIWIANGGSGEFDQCTIEYATYSTGYGIRALSGSSVTIDGCEVRSCDVGILLDTVPPGSVENTWVHDVTTHGIHAFDVMPTISGCTVENAETGIRLEDIPAAALSSANIVQNVDVGIHFVDCAGVNVSNQSITGASGTEGALFIDDSGEFHVGTGNLIAGNSWGLTMTIGSYPDFASAPSLPIAGNTNDDGIQVTAGSITGDATWRDLGVDYVLTATPTVSSGHVLTIEDGVTVRFDDTEYLSVSGGALSAIGDTDGILLTRRAADDEWRGIWLQNGATGAFDGCTIEYATYSTGYGIRGLSALSVSIESCEIRNCDVGVELQNVTAGSVLGTSILDVTQTGIQVEDVMPEIFACIIDGAGTGMRFEEVSAAELTTTNTVQNVDTGLHFDACTGILIADQGITNATGPEGAIFVEDSGAFRLGPNVIAGNSWGLSMNIGSYPDPPSAPNLPIAGNTNDDGIQVTGGATMQSVTWTYFAIPFIVTGAPIVQSGGVLTIEDGVTVKFENAARLSANGGTIGAIGSTAGILFTRRDALDEWRGLWLESGGSATFERCTIEHATYSTGYGVRGINALSVNVEDSEIRFCDVGVSLENVTSASILATSIHDISTRAIQADDFMPTISGCIIDGAGTGIHLEDIAAAALSTANAIQNTDVGIHFETCAGVDVSNQAITGASGDDGALFIEDSGEFHIGTGNVISGNSWGLTMNVDSYPDVASAPNLPIAGNTNDDGIQVAGGSTARSVVWRALGIDFVVTTTSSVITGGLLTIEDGVTARFENGTYLNVTGGTLDAVGSTSGILFTRRTALDEWRGVWLQNGAAGTLEGCTIEYGTYSTGYGVRAFGALSASIESSEIRSCDVGIVLDGVPTGSVQGTNVHAITFAGIEAHDVMPTINACVIDSAQTGIRFLDIPSAALSTANAIQNSDVGIHFDRCAGVSVSNQAITGATGDEGALFIEDSGEFHIGTGNVIGGNAWGLTINASSWPDLASAPNLPIAGNTSEEGIQVKGGHADGPVSWHDLGADFIVTSAPTVQSGGTLTIADGVNVRFENATLLSVSGGTLNAIGSSSGILFTRRTPEDEWKGIWLQGGAGGTFEGCTIEYGTHATGYGIRAIDANAVSLTSCVVRANDIGVYASNSSPSFINCEIRDNGSYGIDLDGASAPTFGSSLAEWNDVRGNGNSNPGRDLRNGTEDIVAAYVWWGTVTMDGIEARIEHEPDDAGLGLATYTPWTGSQHAIAYTDTPPVDVDDPVAVPAAFSLSPNLPNPFRSGTTFRYALPVDSHVRLDVFDVSGRVVATLVDGVETAGFKAVRWAPRDLGSGTYFYRLRAGSFVKKGSLVVLR